MTTPPSMVWRTSSYSATGTNCVEVGAPPAAWRTSSYSQGGTQCVEVGPGMASIGVRDSKARERGALAVSPRAWAAFVAGVRAGIGTAR